MKISSSCFFSLLLFCLRSVTVMAQQNAPEKILAPVTTTFAIRNATVIPSPGQEILNATVVMKDGLIRSVGAGLIIPPEAIIIEGDSLFVYAGFIDGLSHTGVVKPKEDRNGARPKDPGNPLPELAGICPQEDVRNSLNAGEPSVKDLRAVGFTTAHVVPHGGMLPGYGAIIQLNGDDPDKMVVIGESSLFSQLKGAPRVYPATLMGVMAKWRELYRQAQQSKGYEVLYASNRTGLVRPVSNRILEAFYPVIDRRMPVVFEAETFLDVHRILSLQKDLGFLLTVGNLKEGWDAIEKLKASQAKLFLSLDLPEKSKKDSSEIIPATSTPETRALEKRKEAFMALYVGQAASFQKAGLRFGFSTLSVKPKQIRPNLLRMISAGLTEARALAALTTDPAQLLGLSDRMGTVEQGKIANLVVTRKPYFQEQSKVHYVFVEGRLFEYPLDQPKPEKSVSPDITGTWTVIVESTKGAREETVTIRRDGPRFSGSLTGADLEEAIVLEGISLDVKKLVYSYTIEEGGQSYKVDVQATVEGDIYKGTATIGSVGSFPLKAKKDPHH